MENLWTLKFDMENKLPILVRSKTNVGENISFLSNRVYENIQNSASDPINVLNDFAWTKSPKESRQDVPKLRLIEKRLTKNSTVTNAAYSLLAGADLVRTATTMAADVGDAVTGNRNEPTLKKALNSLVESKTVSLIQDALGQVSNVAGLGSLQTFNSEVLKAYNFLYATEKTGFEYILPYLDDNYRNSQIQMGESQNNVVSNITNFLQTGVQTAAGIIGALRPGVYIETAKQFKMGDAGRTLNVTIPLLNTGTFDDIVKNWQLIYGLVYQNRPGRITKNLVDVPVIYEAFIEGIAYMPYAYISGLSVGFIGNRRTMKLKVPINKGGEEGSEFSTQVSEIETAIPDAYNLNITIEGLNDETRNFMYQSIDGLPVTVSSELPSEPATTEAPGTDTTQGGPTSFSSRSNPDRRQLRNPTSDPPSQPTIKRRNN
jgi:hypothetical protein